jgi:hypothetical protein
MTHYATLKDSSDRYQTWLQVFGSPTVPILSPIPVENDGPDGRREFYRLDTKKLTLRQRRRLVEFLAKRWQLPHGEIVRTMDDPEHGVPIRATDVVVPLDLRFFT